MAQPRGPLELRVCAAEVTNGAANYEQVPAGNGPDTIRFEQVRFRGAGTGLN